MIENARSRHVEHQLSQQGEQLSLLQAENDNKKLGQNWLLLMEDIRLTNWFRAKSTTLKLATSWSSWSLFRMFFLLNFSRSLSKDFKRREVFLLEDPSC